MTHRVHPYIFRLGIVTNWKSRWFHSKKYRDYLAQDTLIRQWLNDRLSAAHVSDIEIERSPNRMSIIIKTGRPGLVIGRGGEGIQKLKADIERRLGVINRRLKLPRPPANFEIKLTIEEVRAAETNAAIVAALIREDLEKRVRFRRVLKQVIDKVSSHKEVKGVKVMLSGRLDGAEMSRTEWLKSGRIPLQTIRANVDYALVEAHTTYGTIGIKVWIYKGDVFDNSKIKDQISK